MDYYFNQLMEIQNSTDHSFFLLDQDSEPRFVIEADKRTIIIPAEFQFLGVKTDQRSEKIYFEVDRIFDDVDLSTKTCVIQYINAGTDDVDEGIYPVTELDTTTVPGKIVFKWEVDNIVCKYAGVVAFSVRFYEIDPETKLYTYCWNTIPESLPVLDGLNVSGSVTEDFPTELLEWNARMAALNTEITNKISAADATMKADLKTAKGYMDGAQAARGGAEEAESRVKKIVAGNEAYTKTESDNVYAKSQVKESERGTSVEVYPEDGSNLAVTAYGFTEQAGTGDPSPTNVRQLTNGGVVLASYVLDGSADETYETGNNNSFVFRAYPRNTSEAVFQTGAYSSALKATSAETLAFGSNSGIAFSNTNGLLLRFAGITTQDALKAYLQANPLTVWYPTTDGTGSLYAPIIMTGSEYRATCLPLTAPLCDGDSVVSWIKSGCDKALVLDGSEDEGWVRTDAGSGYRFQAKVLVDAVYPATSSDKIQLFTNWLSNLSATDTYNRKEGISVSQNTSYTPALVYIYLDGVTELSDFKARLAAHPLTVWYRSTNYTETNDIPVSLETHVRGEYVFDGTEELISGGTAEKSFVYIKTLYPKGKMAQNDVSNMFPCVDIQTTNTVQGFEVTANQVFIRWDEEFKSVEEAKAFFAAKAAAGTPATIVYQLATPITYAHPAVEIISNISDNDSVLISGQKEVSVSYHKSLNKTIIELDNKSYSKQDSHNIFARALRGTAEAAKSITIHPDVGSNVAVTSHGFTKQEGSGDASPTNVRKIITGGVKYGVVVYDGSSDESYSVNGKAFIISPKPSDMVALVGPDTLSPLVCNRLASKAASATWSGQEGVSQASGSDARVQVYINGVSTGTDLRSWLKNNPITVWYPFKTENSETGVLRTKISASGNGYTGTCAELTAPLCQGDTLITKVKSGCDKKIIFDGSEDEDWTLAFQNNGFYIRISDVVNAPNDSAVTGHVFSSYLSEITSGNIYYAKYPFGISLYTTAKYICVRIKGIATVSALKEYFASNPLTVWYRSVNYTEANDIPVSLETHLREKITFSSSNLSTVDSTKVGYIKLSHIGKGSSYPISSHIKSISPYQNSNGIYVNADGSTISFRLSDDLTTKETISKYLDAQIEAGTPVEAVYELAKSIVYAHESVDFIANPNGEGAWVITGEADGTVSAEYNKDITYAFNELQSAVLSAIANLSL